jgi:Glycosyl hydrolase catalytic core
MRVPTAKYLLHQGGPLALALLTCLGCSDGSKDAGDDLGAALPGCKRGIAIPGQRLEAAALSKGLSWWYNWSSAAAASPASVAFVPMVRAASDIDRASQAVGAGAAQLLGFNEPNFFAQANLSADSAAALCPQLQAIADAHQLALTCFAMPGSAPTPFRRPG